MLIEFVFNVNARIQKNQSQLSVLTYFSRVYIYCFYVFVFSFQKTNFFLFTSQIRFNNIKKITKTSVKSYTTFSCTHTYSSL